VDRAGSTDLSLRDIADPTQRGRRQPGVPSMFDSLEVKVLYPT